MLNADEAIIRSARFDDYARACRLNDAVDEALAYKYLAFIRLQIIIVLYDKIFEERFVGAYRCR